MIGNSRNFTAEGIPLGGASETGGAPAVRNGRTKHAGVLDATTETTSGGALAPGLLTSGSHATGNDARGTQGARQTPRRSKVLPKARHAVRALYGTCLESLDRAENQTDNFFARNAALEQLRGALANLWAMRNSQEEQFAEVINMLQSLFVERRVEDFQYGHLAALRSVFERLRIEFEVDDQLANDLTRILLQGGLDVFRELE